MPKLTTDSLKVAVYTFKIQQALLDEITTYAAQHNVSASSCIREAIAEFLGHDDYQDAPTPEQRAERRAAKMRGYMRDMRARQA